MTVAVIEPSPLESPQTAGITPAPLRGRSDKPVSDPELLRRFVRLQDQAAFAELVRRHSRLVHGVCRRVLRSEHDIEDAFQATFLVLARDAARIRKQESLPSWLHGVAYRTSLRACDSSRRRGRLLRDVTMIEEPADDSPRDGPFAQVEQRSQRQALDEELAALPDKYRAPLVLHYLDGKSNQQVAEELELTVTAVEGRLKRGKRELRLRLARRGIGLSVAVAAMQAVPSAVQAAPLDTLIARTIDAGLSFAGGEAAGPVYTPEAARLAGQELAAMSTTSAVTLAAVVLVPLTLGFAGHDGPPNSAVPTAVVNTALAQAGSEGINEASLGTDDAAEEPDLSLLNVSSFRVVTSDNGQARLIVTSRDGQRFVLNSRIKSQDLDPKTGTTEFDAEVILFSKDVPLELEFSDSGLGYSVGGTGSGGAANPLVAALQHNVSLHFDQAPLSEAIQSIAASTNINVLIDKSHLATVGVNTDTPVSIDVEGVPLRTALERLLSPLGLVATAEDQVLKVTSKARSTHIDSNAARMGLGGGSLPGGGAGMGMGRWFPSENQRLDRSQGAKERILRFDEQSPTERRIEAALDGETQVEFLDTPLFDAIAFLAEMHNITILLDEGAVDEVGVDRDTPVNLIMNGVKLRSVLNQMLRPLALKAIIRDEVLTVTTDEIAEEQLETRVYDVSQLALPEEELIELLETSVPDADWEESDGVGGTARMVQGALVVMQTQAVHGRVVDLLSQLQRHRENRGPGANNDAFGYGGGPSALGGGGAPGGNTGSGFGGGFDDGGFGGRRPTRRPSN